MYHTKSSLRCIKLIKNWNSSILVLRANIWIPMNYCGPAPAREPSLHRWQWPRCSSRIVECHGTCAWPTSLRPEPLPPTCWPRSGPCTNTVHHHVDTDGYGMHASSLSCRRNAWIMHFCAKGQMQYEIRCNMIADPRMGPCGIPALRTLVIY